METRDDYPVPRMASQLDMGTFSIWDEDRLNQVGWAWRQNAQESWIVEKDYRLYSGTKDLMWRIDYEDVDPPHNARQEFVDWVRLRCQPHKTYYHYWTDDQKPRENFNC